MYSIIYSYILYVIVIIDYTKWILNIKNQKIANQHAYDIQHYKFNTQQNIGKQSLLQTVATCNAKSHTTTDFCIKTLKAFDLCDKRSAISEQRTGKVQTSNTWWTHEKYSWILRIVAVLKFVLHKLYNVESDWLDRGPQQHGSSVTAFWMRKFIKPCVTAFVAFNERKAPRLRHEQKDGNCKLDGTENWFMSCSSTSAW